MQQPFPAATPRRNTSTHIRASLPYYMANEKLIPFLRPANTTLNSPGRMPVVTQHTRWRPKTVSGGPQASARAGFASAHKLASSGSLSPLPTPAIMPESDTNKLWSTQPGSTRAARTPISGRARESFYPQGRPLTGCEPPILPWSMGYWSAHNVYSQPGSYSEGLSTVPYNRFTRPPQPFRPPVRVGTTRGAPVESEQVILSNGGRYDHVPIMRRSLSSA